MRAVLVLVAAVTFGLAGGYAWSALAPHPSHVRVPKVPKAEPLVISETSGDRQWAARAEAGEAPAAAPAANAAQDAESAERSAYYAGCNEARAAGHAPIYRGEPGYRGELDGDGDGIACEPHRVRP